MSTMWKLKCCPKCKGDVFLEKDQFGWYEQCLQCGYLKDLDTIYEVKNSESENTTKSERNRNQVTLRQ